MGNITPEHSLQIRVKQFVRDCVLQPHRFACFDRSRPQSKFQHLREQQRGVLAGEPDTELLVPGLAVKVELKVKPNRPSLLQLEQIDSINKCSHYAGVAYSVVELCEHYEKAGVRMTEGARFKAAELDIRWAEAIGGRKQARQTKKRLEQKVTGEEGSFW